MLPMGSVARASRPASHDERAAPACLKHSTRLRTRISCVSPPDAGTGGRREEKAPPHIAVRLDLQAVGTAGFEPATPLTPCESLRGRGTTPSSTHAMFWASES